MKSQLIMVAGTRPEIIKIYPLLKALDENSIEYTLIWSGQHYDFEMSTIFFEEFNIRKPDIVLNIPRGADLIQQVANIGHGLKKVIKNQRSIVYALGDTSTTAATALATFYSNNIFVHDESGVRSYDPLMIEEGNRKLADALASFHFAPTIISVLNLLREGIPNKTIYLTGSSLVDVFNKFYPKISKRANEVLMKLNIEQKKIVLVTIHRRENLFKNRLRKLIVLLKTLATKYSDYNFVFPIHPHTYLKLKEYGFLNEIISITNIKLVKPLSYFDFIAILSASSFVMTDSGGVQQEAFLAGKPILTLRPYTEWIETVILGYNFIVDLDVDYSLKIIKQILENNIVLEKICPNENPMGDGNSGRRVARILAILLNGIEKIYDALKIAQRGPKYNVSMINMVTLPKLSKKIDNIMLCFNEEDLPFIFIDCPINKKKIDRAKLTCITMNYFYLNDIKLRKKFIDLVKVNWYYIDKILNDLITDLMTKNIT